MVCRGFCLTNQFETKAKRGYQEGFKFCKQCGPPAQDGIYIKWDGVFCPCCGQNLRVRPANRKYRKAHEVTV